MLDLEGIYKNESVEDVLLYFAPRTPYPSIDRMYVNYKFEVVANGRLLKTYQRLVREGKLLENEKPLPEKGPNWKEPKFVTEKKYGIV
ncbi:immunity protein [Pseudomonas paraeruginosa]|uniref:immunity protein n=1 Tax=Pseudomonas paraeruginosa TaxID=2994495 RepID=UPI0024DEE1F3|nr:immunity protein [Pseudomonas paraeruginosa]MDK2353118.1 immunity protein [Pseudomonas paraeruginosa]